MGATLGASRRSLIRTSAARAWSVWIGDSATAISRALMLGAATLLFLSAAATLEASFTMTASYALALLAAGIGAPAALRGWLRLTPFASLAVAAIVAIYIIAAWIGTDAVVPSQRTALGHRDLAYVLDLILGFAVVGLVVDAFRDRRSLRRLVVCSLLRRLRRGGICDLSVARPAFWSSVRRREQCRELRWLHTRTSLPGRRPVRVGARPRDFQRAVVPRVVFGHPRAAVPWLGSTEPSRGTDALACRLDDDHASAGIDGVIARVGGTRCGAVRDGGGVGRADSARALGRRDRVRAGPSS